MPCCSINASPIRIVNQQRQYQGDAENNIDSISRGHEVNTCFRCGHGWSMADCEAGGHLVRIVIQSSKQRGGTENREILLTRSYDKMR